MNKRKDLERIHVDLFSEAFPEHFRSAAAALINPDGDSADAPQWSDWKVLGPRVWGDDRRKALRQPGPKLGNVSPCTLVAAVLLQQLRITCGWLGHCVGASTPLSIQVPCSAFPCFSFFKLTGPRKWRAREQEGAFDRMPCALVSLPLGCDFLLGGWTTGRGV